MAQMTTNKIMLLGGIAIFALAGFAMFVGWMLSAGVALWFILILIMGLVGFAVAWFILQRKTSKTIDLEKTAFLDIFESTFMSNVPMPQSLVTSLTGETATAQCHAGDIYGVTKLPVDEKFFDLTTGKKPSKVWAFRMRMAKKWGRKDTYIALVCDEQISQMSKDTSGGLQFNTTVLAQGAWARYGMFYCLWNTPEQLASQQASADTVKAFVALKESQNRLIEATSNNAMTKTEIVDTREAKKQEIEIVTK